ncbi:TIGR02391 family protein [Deferribacteres bacterium DY0037]
MSALPILTDGQLQSLSRLLGECGTGSDIDRVFKDRSLQDKSGESTKWKRLYWVFADSQRQYKCSNKIIDFIQAYFDPARYISRNNEFEERREELNKILVFAGLKLGKDGKIQICDKASTLEEAERRVQTIRTKFKYRSMHPEVFNYCNQELMQENYFHAVFEAAKGLAQRVRDMSDVDLDGAALVEAVFSVDKPVLALNTLQTETERSEHKGFAMLLKGCFAAIRNPRAHEPKILWSGDDDAADYLTLISLLHRKLDNCTKVP